MHRRGQQLGYRYVDADTLCEDKRSIIVDSLLKEALIRINHISDSEAQIVVEQVKSIVYSGIGGRHHHRQPATTWANGAKDMLCYQKSIPEMFVPNILSLASEGKDLYYGSIGTPLAKWEDLPADWVCPLCSVGKDHFSKQ